MKDNGIGEDVDGGDVAKLGGSHSKEKVHWFHHGMQLQWDDIEPGLVVAEEELTR